MIPTTRSGWISRRCRRLPSCAPRTGSNPVHPAGFSVLSKGRIICPLLRTRRLLQLTNADQDESTAAMRLSSEQLTVHAKAESWARRQHKCLGERHSPADTLWFEPVGFDLKPGVCRPARRLAAVSCGQTMRIGPGEIPRQGPEIARTTAHPAVAQVTLGAGGGPDRQGP